MNIIISLIFLLLSFVILWFSSDKAISYTTDIAHQMGVSNLFIGFAILSFATGFPELLIAIHSLMAGKPQLSVGDIIGSNFVDISLALGISAAFIGPIYIEYTDYLKQFIMLAISSFVMAFIFINGYITRPMGLALLGIYVVGMTALYRYRRVKFETNNHTSALKNLLVVAKNGILFKLAGYLLLVLGSSKVAVDTALRLGQDLNIPLTVLGATIFSVGTSLPEISLNIQAVRQKKYTLALGNSLGSVFGQAALILGLLASFSPYELPIKHFYPIIPFMFASYGIILFHLLTRKKINRISGLILIGLYVGFVAYEFLRMY